MGYGHRATCHMKDLPGMQAGIFAALSVHNDVRMLQMARK